ncbi:hypothetical protein DFJ74DRAFT_324134 [Hyaloraphidium curvatum]|nr:hypothetical protein DFJ74DRAFT_324134 [Hyaloraphidium curvatum]
MESVRDWDEGEDASHWGGVRSGVGTWSGASPTNGYGGSWGDDDGDSDDADGYEDDGDGLQYPPSDGDEGLDMDEAELIGGDGGLGDDSESDDPSARRLSELANKYDAFLLADMAAIDRALAENAMLQGKLLDLVTRDAPEDTAPLIDTALYPTRTPYFVSKDRQGPLAPPANQNPRLRPSSLLFAGNNYWSVHEAARLKSAVINVARQKVLMLVQRDFMQKGMTSGIAKGNAKVQVDRMDSHQILGLVRIVMDDPGWARVAELVKTRTGAECRARWTNRDFAANVEKWTAQEKDKLVAAVTSGEHSGWTEIAKKVGRGRTAIDCFRTWKKVAQERGIDESRPRAGFVIREKAKTVAFKPASQAVKKAGDSLSAANTPRSQDEKGSSRRRTRAIESKPLLRKGKWLPNEDEDLVKGVALYGTSWAMVQLLVPTRSDTQCRERYLNHLAPGARSKDPFTPEERRRLGELVERHGRKWATIALAFGNKFSDDRCRREWESITKSGGASRTGSEDGSTPVKRKAAADGSSAPKRKKTAKPESVAAAEEPASPAPGAEAGSGAAPGTAEPANGAHAAKTGAKDAKPARVIAKWTAEDVERLRELIAIHGNSWGAISAAFGGRFNKDRVRRKWNEVSFADLEREQAAEGMEGGIASPAAQQASVEAAVEQPMDTASPIAPAVDGPNLDVGHDEALGDDPPVAQGAPNGKARPAKNKKSRAKAAAVPAVAQITTPSAAPSGTDALDLLASEAARQTVTEANVANGGPKSKGRVTKPKTAPAAPTVTKPKAAAAVAKATKAQTAPTGLRAHTRASRAQSAAAVGSNPQPEASRGDPPAAVDPFLADVSVEAVADAGGMPLSKARKAASGPRARKPGKKGSRATSRKKDAGETAAENAVDDQ